MCYHHADMSQPSVVSQIGNLTNFVNSVPLESTKLAFFAPCDHILNSFKSKRLELCQKESKYR